MEQFLTRNIPEEIADMFRAKLEHNTQLLEQELRDLIDRNVSDEAMTAFKTKAEINARSLEQQLLDILVQHLPYTEHEYAAARRKYSTQSHDY
jgi:plasmid stability protein